MDNTNKNPLVAGLMNVVLAGSSQLYVNHDWGWFAGAFVRGVVAFAAAIWGKPCPKCTRICPPSGNVHGYYADGYHHDTVQ